MAFDATFWALIALILFFVLIAFLGVPAKVTGALDTRAKAIRQELDEARRLREEAQGLLAEYQRKAREAEQEASDIVDQARREAAAFAAEAEERVRDYVERRTRMAEQKIAQAETQALQEVKATSADVAIAAAERVLRDRVQGGVATDLIDRSIGEVRGRLN